MTSRHHLSHNSPLIIVSVAHKVTPIECQLIRIMENFRERQITLGVNERQFNAHDYAYSSWSAPLPSCYRRGGFSSRLRTRWSPGLSARPSYSPTYFKHRPPCSNSRGMCLLCLALHIQACFILHLFIEEHSVILAYQQET